MDKVYCNLGSGDIQDQSLEWLIDCLNTLPDNELKYVLTNLRMSAKLKGQEENSHE